MNKIKTIIFILLILLITSCGTTSKCPSYSKKYEIQNNFEKQLMIYNIKLKLKSYR